MTDNLKNKAVTGASWLLVAQVGSQVVKFAVAAVLARILTPEEFGLIGMVLIFSGFANLFNDMGFSDALIQKQDVNDRHFSSVFWLNLFIALLMMALLALGAPLLASFFNQPELTPLARLLSINFLIGSLVIVIRAKLTRSMDFRTLSVIEIIAALASGILGIVLALLGFGVYALVAQILGMTACLTVLIWLSSDWRPSWLFSFSAIRELLGFSMGIMGGNSLNYWIRNADNLLIGKVLGTTELGLYSRAYMIMLLPLSQISGVLTRVMFPTLASIQGDKARSRQIYLRAISAIALFTFPSMLGLLVIADDFVLVVFGSKWSEMIPVLRVLCIVGMLQSVNATVGWIYNSQGRSDIQFWWIFFGSILTFVAFGIGIYWGILGVATAYAIRVFSTTWLNFYIPGRLIEMSVKDVAKVLYQPLLLSIAMAALVAFAGLIIPDVWSQPLRLLVLIATGVLVFTCSIHWFKLPAYTDLIQIARENGFGMRRRLPHST